MNSLMTLDLTNNIIKNARALIWKRKGDKIFFLLTQESSGSFTMPGGCKDLEDPNLITGLQRELREELGFDPADYSIRETNIRKEYENLYDMPSERVGKKTVISIFIVSGLSKEPTPSSEIKGIAWMTADEAIKAFNRLHFKELFEMAVGKLLLTL
jgi:8-oxo-dGTP pyrophosphatase MutT (NUDIX family)